MTLTTEPSRSLLNQQHLVLENVSWEFYEQLLEEIGDGTLRVTYDNGSIEIMSPLPEHEFGKKIISRLLELMALELSIPILCFGSTTFRRKEKKTGLEPDECYYLKNAARVGNMKRFDPAIHPAPDLAIEVDITSRSIEREPLYAALGVAELWRFDGSHIAVLILDNKGHYYEATVSSCFPYLPMNRFTDFATQLEKGDQIAVLNEFRQFVQSLKRS